jgi:Na+/H+-dicarboxylate symporter
MRSVLLSLLLSIGVFALFAALPASLGVVSLLRMLVFVGAAACLVAAVLLSTAALLGDRSLGRTDWTPLATP